MQGDSRRQVDTPGVRAALEANRAQLEVMRSRLLGKVPAPVPGPVSRPQDRAQDVAQTPKQGYGDGNRGSCPDPSGARSNPVYGEASGRLPGGVVSRSSGVHSGSSPGLCVEKPSHAAGSERSSLMLDKISSHHRTHNHQGGPAVVLRLPFSNPCCRHRLRCQGSSPRITTPSMPMPSEPPLPT